MSHKPVLPFLETMITQVCNLSCEGCTNHSDLHHEGYVTWNQGRADLESWCELLHIAEFGIMGGEPMINPQWQEWLLGVRKILPHARIRFTTNGTRLHRYPDVLDLLDQVGDVTFKITVHAVDADLEKQITSYLVQRAWSPVLEFGINRWAAPNGLRLQINRPQTFVKTFRHDYHDMLPWYSDPVRAFAECCQPTCPLLYQGRIYKCSTSALRRDVLARFGDPNLEAWLPFLDQGISVTSDPMQITEFLSNFGHEHMMCGQCPSSEHRQSRVSHMITVKRK